MVILRVNVNGNQRWVDAAQVAVFVDFQPALPVHTGIDVRFGNGFAVFCALFSVRCLSALSCQLSMFIAPYTLL
ncbi:hypothetical protein AH396_23270 [Salmonella enterica subsp. enterica]|nr:hypothetical protein [Salmonella enterica subsp. enterica]